MQLKWGSHTSLPDTPDSPTAPPRASAPTPQQQHFQLTLLLLCSKFSIMPPNLLRNNYAGSQREELALWQRVMRKEASA